MLCANAWPFVFWEAGGLSDSPVSDNALIWSCINHKSREGERFTLGYNDFNNLVLPGRWRLQYVILRNIYKKSFFRLFQPFLTRLHSKVVKSAYMIKKSVFLKCNIFDVDFESVEKIAKILCEKSYQNVKEFLTFITECKSFLPFIFWVIFCTFFNGWELFINFTFYDTHIKFLKKYFFVPILAQL